MELNRRGFFGTLAAVAAGAVAAMTRKPKSHPSLAFDKDAFVLMWPSDKVSITWPAGFIEVRGSGTLRQAHRGGEIITVTDAHR